MKILIAVDGSPYSAKAVKYVAAHLDWWRGEPEVHLLHVKLPIPVGRPRAVIGEEAVQRYYEEEAHAALAPAERILLKKKLPFQSSYKIGSIAEEIRAYAKKKKIDLIVMGSHGHGVLQNLVMGSVATRVLAIATVPVLIVH